MKNKYNLKFDPSNIDKISRSISDIETFPQVNCNYFCNPFKLVEINGDYFIILDSAIEDYYIKDIKLL